MGMEVGNIAKVTCGNVLIRGVVQTFGWVGKTLAAEETFVR